MQLVRRAWYFAARGHQIDRGPFHRKICGEDLAFFRDEEGSAHAVSAVCPHRGANLAGGRVVDGAIECPYHGWRFASDGHCTRIPSQPPDVKIPPKARLPVYPVREQQGVLWVWPDREVAPFEEPPRLAALDDTEALVGFSTDLLESEFINVMENAYDDSHVHFLHDATAPVGTPIVPCQIVDEEPDGRGLVWYWDPETPWGHELFRSSEAPGNLLGRLLNWSAGRVLQPQRRVRFRLGGLVHFEHPTDRGHVFDVIGFGTPCDEHRTWFTTALRHPLVRQRWLRPVFDRFGKQLNGEDQTGTVGLLKPASELTTPISVRSDRSALAFRRLYEEAARRESSSRNGDVERPRATPAGEAGTPYAAPAGVR